MPIFTLKSIPEIQGKIEFYYLIIDGVNNYKEFEDQIIREGTYEKELVTIQARLQEMADRKHLPQNKCRNITPQKEKVPEIEIKTTNLRVYIIHEKHKGRIILYEGKKNTQDKDIRKFRSLKKLYLNQL